jgi:hypothetical protein
MQNLWNEFILWISAKNLSDLIQLGILAVLLFTLLCIYRQLRITVKMLRLNTELHQRELFITLTDTLPDDEFKACMTHVSDYFDMIIYPILWTIFRQRTP